MSKPARGAPCKWCHLTECNGHTPNEIIGRLEAVNAEMLEALKAILHPSSHARMEPECWDKLKAAIRKAEGRES